MTAKLTRLTQKIAMELHLHAESCTICNSETFWYTLLRWISGCGQPIKGSPPDWGLGEGLTIPRRKTACHDTFHMASNLTDSFEHGDEPSDYIRGGEFLYYMGDYWILRKESTTGSKLVC